MSSATGMYKLNSIKLILYFSASEAGHKITNSSSLRSNSNEIFDPGGSGVSVEIRSWCNRPKNVAPSGLNSAVGSKFFLKRLALCVNPEFTKTRKIFFIWWYCWDLILF